MIQLDGSSWVALLWFCGEERLFDSYFSYIYKVPSCASVATWLILDRQHRNTTMQVSLHLNNHQLPWTLQSRHRLRPPSPSAVRIRPLPSITAVAAPPTPPVALKHQKTHSMPPEKVEIFKSLENWAAQNVLPFLKPVDLCWQPQNFLPDPAMPFDDFTDQVRELRTRTSELPDEYFLVLVGDMITEEALPTYQTMINTLDGVRDETGASRNPWAVWTRSWTAEENRHGDLLKTYLYLSGRVDMAMIEKTVQYLIGAGMVIFLFNYF